MCRACCSSERMSVKRRVLIGGVVEEEEEETVAVAVRPLPCIGSHCQTTRWPEARTAAMWAGRWRAILSAP